MSLTEIGWEVWTGLIYWQAIINMVMNLGVPPNFRISLSVAQQLLTITNSAQWSKFTCNRHVKVNAVQLSSKGF
jgi:hypothetical protein